MKLIELLSIIKVTAENNKLSTPYIVGGLPRDILIKKLHKINDVDITCGDHSSLLLAQSLVKVIPNSTVTLFSDGHSRLSINDFKVDFSSNYNIPNVEKYVGKKLSPIHKELYSRDFNINTLLMPLDLSTVIDATGLGIKQVKQKLIDTVLEPEVTLTSDPKRIIRLVYLGAKLNFQISDRVKSWVVSNATFENVPEGYVKQKLNESYKINPVITSKLLEDLNLTNKLPKNIILK